jgi:hypothetical protein
MASEEPRLRVADGGKVADLPEVSMSEPIERLVVKLGDIATTLTLDAHRGAEGCGPVLADAQAAVDQATTAIGRAFQPERNARDRRGGGPFANAWKALTHAQRLVERAHEAVEQSCRLQERLRVHQAESDRKR